AGNAELGGDLLLGIAGHVIKPAGPCGFVEPGIGDVVALSHCRSCGLGADYSAMPPPAASGLRSGRWARRLRATRMSRSVSFRCMRMASPAARPLPALMQSRMR